MLTSSFSTGEVCNSIPSVRETPGEMYAGLIRTTTTTPSWCPEFLFNPFHGVMCVTRILSISNIFLARHNLSSEHWEDLKLLQTFKEDFLSNIISVKELNGFLLKFSSFLFFIFVRSWSSCGSSEYEDEFLCIRYLECDCNHPCWSYKVKLLLCYFILFITNIILCMS